jgi:hypothetical protein
MLFASGNEGEDDFNELVVVVSSLKQKTIRNHVNGWHFRPNFIYDEKKGVT